MKLFWIDSFSLAFTLLFEIIWSIMHFYANEKMPMTNGKLMSLHCILLSVNAKKG